MRHILNVNKDSIINVYYHDEEAQTRLINRINDIIGEEEVMARVRFIYQHDNGLEYRNIFVINGNTQKFNLSEVKLFDPKNQKVIKRKKYYDWYDIKSGSNISDLYQVILILTTPQAKTKDTVIHTTLEINPNIEMLMSHEYYKGIKVKSIKIKQVEVKKDNYIKNNEVLEGEPNCISVIIEITDMKGNTIELLGMQSLSQGDYTFRIKE